MNKVISCLIITLISINYVNSKISNCGAIVTTKWGILQGNFGQVNGRYYDEFKGMRYAPKPKRFEASKVYREPWIGIYAATKYGPKCSQAVETDISEDCLYLNIWRPWFAQYRNKALLIPVFIYIHGSDFIYGSGANLAGEILATRENIIVITINYRLNSFGYAYGDNKLMPGNAGLTDVSTAIQWVKENIFFFGGDPNQITVGGFSAGSVLLVLFHTLLPDPKRLYNRLLLMSGTAITGLFIESKEIGLDKTKLLAEKVGCGHLGPGPIPPSVIKCLQNVDPSLLVRYDQNSDIIALGNSGNVSFIPVYGTDLVPKPLLKLIGSKNQSVPMIFWMAQDEQGMFYDNGQITSFKEAYDFTFTMLSTLKKNLSKNEMDEFFNYYFHDADPMNTTDLRNRAFSLVNDFGFRCPTLFTSQAYSTFGNVYVAEIRYIIEKYGAIKRPGGAFHADPQELIFGLPLNSSGYSTQDRNMSKRLMNFIGDYVTGTFNDPDWPLINYNPKQPEHNPIVKLIDYQDSYVIYEKQPICLRWGQLLGYDIRTSFSKHVRKPGQLKFLEVLAVTKE